MHRRLPIVLSLLALVASLLALAQRGSAGSVLAPHSVGTAQLKNGAVTAVKVHRHTLTKLQFKAGQLPAGPPGEPGPSAAYAASIAGPVAVVVQAEPATLAQLEIPQAGSYVIAAKAWFDSSGSGIATIDCTLDTLEGDVDDVQLLAGNPTPASLSVAHTYSAPGAVALRCAARATAAAHDVRITAIRVGTLTVTGP